MFFYYDFIEYSYLTNILTGIAVAGLSFLAILITAYTYKLSIIFDKMPTIVRAYFKKKTISRFLYIYVCLYSLLLLYIQLFCKGVHGITLLFIFCLFIFEITYIIYHVTKQLKELTIQDFFNQKYKINYKIIREKYYKEQNDNLIKYMKNISKRTKKIKNKRMKDKKTKSWKEYKKTFEVVNDLYSILNDTVSIDNHYYNYIIHFIFKYWYFYKYIIKRTNRDKSFLNEEEESITYNWIKKDPLNIHNDITDGLTYLDKNLNHSTYYINMVTLYFEKNIKNNNYINVVYGLKQISLACNNDLLSLFDPSDFQFTKVFKSILDYNDSDEILQLIIEIEQKISNIIDIQNLSIIDYINKIDSIEFIEKNTNLLVEEIITSFVDNIEKESRIYNIPITPLEYYKSLLFSHLCKRNKSLFHIINANMDLMHKNTNDNNILHLKLKIILLERSIKVKNTYASAKDNITGEHYIGYEMNEIIAKECISNHFCTIANPFKKVSFKIGSEEDFLKCTYYIFQLNNIIDNLNFCENPHNLHFISVPIFITNIVLEVYYFSINSLIKANNFKDGKSNNYINIIKIVLAVLYKYNKKFDVKFTMPFSDEQLSNLADLILNCGYLSINGYSEYLNDICENIINDPFIILLLQSNKGEKDEFIKEFKKEFGKE